MSMLCRDEGGWAVPIGWVVLALVVGVAVVQPLISSDNWSYHLPFASRLWGIGDGFELGPISAERWLGYPKAWHWLMGLFWAASGSLRAVILPQMLLVLVFLFYVHRVLGVSTPLLVVGLFASPMLLIHFQSVYLDLPVGLCLATGFLELLDMVQSAREDEHGRVRPWAAIFAIVLLGLAGNIKYQGMIGVILVVGIAAGFALLAPRIGKRQRAMLLAVMTMAVLVAGLSLLSNAIRLGQPLYPMEVKMFGRVLLPGPESPSMDGGQPTYLLGSREISLPEPANYVLSLTELDWTMRGVPPWYNIDAYAGHLPQRGAPSRTGGLGAIFVLFQLALLVVQLVRWRSLADGRQRMLVLGSVILLVLAAFLPRSHELRYWLVVPLVLVVVNLRYLALLRWPAIGSAALVVLMGYSFVVTAMSPGSYMLNRGPVSQAGLRAVVPVPVAEALARTGRYCDDKEPLIFLYSSAVTGVPGHLFRNMAECQ